MPRIIATAAIAASLIVSGAVPALGADSGTSGGFDTISSTGTCSADSTWTLSARSRGLRILTELKVDGSAPGDLWRVKVTQNGRRIVAGRRLAREDGSVWIRRPTRNLPGVDEFAFVAKDRNTREKCTGTLSY